MKLSNIMLSIVAVTISVSAALLTSAYTDIIPTSVINIPNDDGTKGGGVSINIPDTLSDKQAHLLSLAYDIAKKDGHKNPQVLQGIILQETHAGELKSYKVAGQEFGLRPNERYYGVAQIKLSATRDVLEQFPNLKRQFGFHTNADEEIIANLILNDAFNLSVASKYLKVLKIRYKVSDAELVAAYNQGPGGRGNENGQKYARLVSNHISRLN